MTGNAKLVKCPRCNGGENLILCALCMGTYVVPAECAAAYMLLWTGTNQKLSLQETIDLREQFKENA